MFTDKQLKALSYSLDKSRVKTRDKAGMQFDYLETYDVINVANSIFSYMWDYSITKLQEVHRETNQNSNHVITYSAIVKVRIYDTQRNFIEREDTGVGIGTAKSIGDAIDNASKSAVSDALKRTFRTLGSQFGNDLYSKAPIQSNHEQNPQQQTSAYQPPQHSSTPYDYSSLYRLGLNVVEQGNNLVVMGNKDTIFSQKNSIKACGFRWDSSLKLWYKQIEQAA